MKLKVEYLPSEGEEEVVIRCRERTEKVRELEGAIERILFAHSEIAVTLGEVEYYLPKSEVLFFETYGGKVTVHTANNMYYTGLRLFELEELMPYNFVRVSKSCILNAAKVSSVAHNITGASRVTFYGTDKVIYASRAYFKSLKERIYNLRFENK